MRLALGLDMCVMHFVSAPRQHIYASDEANLLCELHGYELQCSALNLTMLLAAVPVWAAADAQILA